MATTAGTKEQQSIPASPPPGETDGAQHRRDRRRVSERFRRDNPQHIRHFISITTARGSSRFARMLPDRVRYWIADRMGDLNYLLIPGYRKNVRDNISHVYRFKGLPEPTSKDVRNVFRTSSRNWADLLVAPKRSVAQFRQEVTMDDASVAYLDAAIARGKGCVLITAHVGAFDYIGHYLHACGYNLTIVTGRTTARIVFDGVSYLREANGIKLVEATASGVRKAIQAVMQGHSAVIVCDRDFFQSGMHVEFFGETTTLPPGAIRIARDTGAMIVPLYGRRVEGGHQITIHEPFAVAKTSDIQADLRDGMAKVVKSLEAGLSVTPDQWVMFQSVWPEGPPSPKG